MEENLTILREGSRVSESDVRGYSPLTLAYIGDAVYELLIRTMVVTSANAPVNKLHKKSSLLAKAPSLPWQRLYCLHLQKKSWQSTSGAEMLILIPRQKTPPQEITAEPQALRRYLAICILRVT